MYRYNTIQYNTMCRYIVAVEAKGSQVSCSGTRNCEVIADYNFIGLVTIIEILVTSGPQCLDSMASILQIPMMRFLPISDCLSFQKMSEFPHFLKIFPTLKNVISSAKMFRKTVHFHPVSENLLFPLFDNISLLQM